MVDRVARSMKLGGTFGAFQRPGDIRKFMAIYNNLKKGEWPDGAKLNPIAEALFDFVGDDDLFDSFDSLVDDFCKDHARLVKTKIKEWVKKTDQEYWANPKTYGLLVEVSKML